MPILSSQYVNTFCRYISSRTIETVSEELGATIPCLGRTRYLRGKFVLTCTSTKMIKITCNRQESYCQREVMANNSAAAEIHSTLLPPNELKFSHTISTGTGTEAQAQGTNTNLER